jgi:phosphate transport system substrate-binding protein
MFARRGILFVGALLALAGAAQADVLLNGAGATFPTPIYPKWFDVFHKREPGIAINYQSVGSGAGIVNITAGAVDFGASDGPMSDEQLRAAKMPLLHFPTVLGAVVLTFNVNRIDRLRFDAETIAGIFLGKITPWDDPALRRLNSVPLPDARITTVHRADGSGTTYVLADYLSKVSPEWQASIGRGTSLKWPGGLARNGNQGVAELVKQTPNSIGYVELVYSVQHDLPYGAVLNRAGKFVIPSIETVTAAAASVADRMPSDFRVSIADPDAPEGYPIASFTWLLIPARVPDPQKGEAMKKFLDWMLGDGQAFAPALLYAPLPPAIVALERQAVANIQVGPP